MIETEEKISIDWKEKYKELREEYGWLWGEYKRVRKDINIYLENNIYKHI